MVFTKNETVIAGNVRVYDCQNGINYRNALFGKGNEDSTADRDRQQGMEMLGMKGIICLRHDFGDGHIGDRRGCCVLSTWRMLGVDFLQHGIVPYK